MIDEVVSKQAAQALAEADALLIGAGAGMGVDSGLPDFRGSEGFWRAYPPFQPLGLSFTDLAQPGWFRRDPKLAWGFYGHRLQLYRNATPHTGFTLLKRWAEAMPEGAWVFTSNVDGQFQRAGFDPANIVECHGSIHHLQCSRPCSEAIWSAEQVQIDVDAATFRARPPLPACPRCNNIARPNVLMFNDGAWISERTDDQEYRWETWLSGLRGGRLVIVECGAGTAIPTVRGVMERLSRRHNAALIRINLREPQGPPGCLSFATGACEALQSIAAARDALPG